MELEGLVFQPRALEWALVLLVVVVVQLPVELEGLVLPPLACSLPSVGQQLLQWVLVQLPAGLQGLVIQPLVTSQLPSLALQVLLELALVLSVLVAVW